MSIITRAGLKGVAATTIILGGAVAAAAGGHVQQGEFSGASGHVTTGGVSLVKTDAGYEIHLADNFSFDGAPDPRVALGDAGVFVASTDFEPLRADSGAQVYKVPAEIDAAKFNSVVIWCRKYSVPLGQARLN